MWCTISQIYFGIELYMFRTGLLSETCRVLYQNKFEKQCISLVFIIRIYQDAQSSECQRDQIRFWINNFLALSTLSSFVETDSVGLRQRILSPSCHLAIDCVFKCQIYVFIINSVKRLTQMNSNNEACERTVTLRPPQIQTKFRSICPVPRI